MRQKLTKMDQSEKDDREWFHRDTPNEVRLIREQFDRRVTLLVEICVGLLLVAGAADCWDASKRWMRAEHSFREASVVQ